MDDDRYCPDDCPHLHLVEIDKCWTNRCAWFDVLLRWEPERCAECREKPPKEVRVERDA